MGKLIIFSAPSGSGKSTIINYLLTQNLNLAFSISATSRPPRGTEQNGVEYFFLTPEEFKQRIANNEFLEYEEVYTDRFYGTLKAQVEKQLEAGQNVIFDVDVVGGCNIKKFYGERALSVFIQPPSVEELRKRLNGRGTDTPEVIESRIAKAEFELSYADKFDVVIVNDDLETAKAEALKVISDFLRNNPHTSIMAKDPKKLLRTMMIVSIVIGLVALAVAVVAVAMKEYIIAAAMLIVAGWQVVNFLKWKKCL